MQNTKRKGFTLMEMVLVMVLIAILATGVAIGFNQFINKGHETGITTDINGTFKNPIRMEAIEQGRLIDIEELTAILINDGFVANSGSGWSEGITDNAQAANTNEADDRFGIEKGSKRYHIEYFADYDVDDDGTADGNPVILIRADHSSENTTAIFYLNDSNTDIETVVGTLDDPATDFTTFTPNN